MKVLWTAKRSNQSVLRKSTLNIIRRTDAEAPIFWTPDVKNQLIGKDPDDGKDLGQEKGATEDKIVVWYHQLNGHEFEQTLGDTKG